MNYFREAEQVLLQRKNLNKLITNLNQKILRIANSGALHDIRGIDYSQPRVQGGAVDDTMKDCIDIIEVKKKIAYIQEEANLIDDVIDQLPEQSKRVLSLWYVKGKTKDQIREELELEGSMTIYNMKNKAIGEFAVLYYGAGAIDFMY